jgi:hypothetical protein
MNHNVNILLGIFRMEVIFYLCGFLFVYIFYGLVSYWDCGLMIVDIISNYNVYK